jgi:hypothetical protein
MVNVSLGFLSIVMSIVLTVQMVEEAIPPGTERAVVESYFSDIGAVSFWMPREARDPATRNFPWREDEVGVITSGVIRNVKKRWWWPSFGRDMIVHVGISADGRVTQLRIQEGMSGWP